MFFDMGNSIWNEIWRNFLILNTEVHSYDSGYFWGRNGSPGKKSLYLPQMSANSSFYFIQGVFPGGEAIPDGIGPKKIFPCPLYPRICPIPGFLAYMASAGHFGIIPAKKAPIIW